ncbi:carbonic anhydrase [Desulfoplanes formicivorans]|uniref:carbonic anhydrase n=1 Tax=Desulfoplanes formicivorans TaxID=1592317 RepID=A0A194AE25_9BACT|nr:carbonic anhydrase [Desulfoplanes formicivorans]GAU08332.1 carbonic anhydrase [Desulfoplanes formicivorans]
MKRLIALLGTLTALLVLTSPLGATTIPTQRMFTPEEALTQLKAGNDRFATGHAIHPNQDRQRRLFTTTKGQHPFATVIACSDSRVPVEILFDQGVGDLFVIKVAGNVLDVDEIASVEYGVDHLETPLMLVLGHTHCGAVTAVVQDAPLHGSIPQLVDNIVPAVTKTKHDHPELTGNELVTAAVINNVWQGITDLLMHSPATRARVQAGTLQVQGAVYDIDTGKVEWLGPHPGQEAIMAAAGPADMDHDAEATGHDEAATHGEQEEHQALTHETAMVDEEQASGDMEEAYTQEVEAQATPQPAEKGGASGLWFIFFLLVIILAAVYMKSKTKS